MKQLKFIALFAGASVLSSITFAHAFYKGEDILAAAPTPYNWSGFYAGLNAGLVQHTMDVTDNQATSFLATIRQTTNPRFTGGLQLGYRQQMDFSKASGVYGLEFGVNFADATYKQIYGTPFSIYQLSTTNTLKQIYLLQLIAGIAADRALLFLAAGVSWADLTGNLTNLNAAAFFNSFNFDKNTAGTAIGGGIEYALTNKLSARFKVDAIIPNQYSTSDSLGNNFQFSNSAIQTTLGINYKFG